jgi:multidrug resistance efflux pump
VYDEGRRGANNPVTETIPRSDAASPDGSVVDTRDAAPEPRVHLPNRLPRRALAPAALAVILVVGVVAWFVRPGSGSAPLVASGTVEVEEVTLSAEMAGRIADLSVDEGNRVIEGQVVGRLEDPVLAVQVKQAVADAAQQQLTQAQMARLELRSPLGGVVQKRIAHRGEFVAPGAPILTVADPSELKLTLYVLEADLGRVATGQAVSIRTDGLPARVFEGRVKTLATRAEFTPRNVTTPRDRQNLVFAVTVSVPNPDGALKAGLPVDATFEQ